MSLRSDSERGAGRNGTGGGPKWGLLLGVLVPLALLGLLSPLLRERFSGRDDAGGQPEPFSYTQGAGQLFRCAGSGLAAVSASEARLLDQNGKLVFRQALSFETPALFTSETGALFCDIGGAGCYSADIDGASRVLRPEGDILTAHRNREGWAALVTEEPGYKAKVTVYDPEGKAKFAWWSGSGYVLRACVSPENRLLAVLCGAKGGGALHLFRLDSEEELASASFPGELPFDLAFQGEDRLWTLSASGLNVLDTAGTLLNRFDFSGSALADYSLEGQDFAALWLENGAGGGTLTTLDRDGSPLGSLDLEETGLSLSAAGRRLLVTAAGGWTLYDRNLSPLASEETALSTRLALLRNDGDVLLLSAYAAERVRAG